MTWRPDYATLTELRQYATRHTDTVDDTELTLAITAASRAIDDHTNRQFGQVAAAEDRKYTAWYNRRRSRWCVDIDDIDDNTGLTVTVTDVGTVSAYDLEPINAAANGQPWTLLSVQSTSSAFPAGADHEVVINGLWGWTAVPDAVKQATLLQASRFFARRTSPYGVAGSPELGSELRLLARVDPDVAVVLAGYVRDVYPT